MDEVREPSVTKEERQFFFHVERSVTSSLSLLS